MTAPATLTPRRPGADHVFLAGVTLWLCFSAGYRALTAPDEGRYAGVAYAMLQSGDWVVPRLNGLPFFHKPPLFYWISAASMRLFGANEWAARVPSLLGALAAATALFAFLRRNALRPQARLATLALCTAPFFFLGAQFSNLDMLVAGCITVTIVAAVDAVLSAQRAGAWRMALALAFVAAGLGLLAKGLIALVLPGAVFVCWCLATGRVRALRLALWPPGWLALLLIALPWFWVMQLRFPAFFDYFVVTQHFRRFASSGFNNEHPFWFYAPVMLVLCLPWSVWMLGWLRRGRARGRARPEDVDLLMMIWLAVIVLFFSVPRSKLIGYILPALPPFAALAARGVLLAMGPFARRGRALLWTGAAGAASCLGCVALAVRLGTPPDATLRLPAGESVKAGDRVIMLNDYFYELPFYWHLSRPVVVAGDWNPTVAQASDNWRKELADAARFDAPAAKRLLQPIESQPAAICQGGRTWVIGPSNAQLAAPWVLGMQLVTFNPHIAVWRHDAQPGQGPDCLARPDAPGALPAMGQAG